MSPQGHTPFRWIGLAGPTASGKTAAALAIADAMPVEIVKIGRASCRERV